MRPGWMLALNIPESGSLPFTIDIGHRFPSQTGWSPRSGIRVGNWEAQWSCGKAEREGRAGHTSRTRTSGGATQSPGSHLFSHLSLQWPRDRAPLVSTDLLWKGHWGLPLVLLKSGSDGDLGSDGSQLTESHICSCWGCRALESNPGGERHIQAE